ncbi:hypothetical protein [Cronobacter condimenti]
MAQLNLFDENAPCANSKALILLMDRLDQQSRGTLYFARQGTVDRMLRREMLLPSYTIRLLMCRLLEQVKRGAGIYAK